MRSTMTRYPEGSPIFVPVSLTNSAVMPCAAPSWFTRSRNAGGNAYSRPHSNPIFIELSGACSRGSLARLVRSRRRLLIAIARFVNQPSDDRLQIACLPEHRKLPIGACAVLDDPVDVLKRLPAPQLVHHVVHELEQLLGEVAHRHFGALAEVDQPLFDAVPRGAPLVLFDQRARIDTEAKIAPP